MCSPRCCGSAVHRRADLELHAVDVSKQQRPLATEILDLTDVRTGGDEPLLHLRELSQGADADPEVVDGTLAPKTSP